MYTVSEWSERSLVFEKFQFIKLLMVNFKRRQIEHEYIYIFKVRKRFYCSLLDCYVLFVYTLL